MLVIPPIVVYEGSIPVVYRMLINIVSLNFPIKYFYPLLFEFVSEAEQNLNEQTLIKKAKRHNNNIYVIRSIVS